MLLMFDVDKPFDENNVIKRWVNQSLFEQVKFNRSGLIEVDKKNYTMDGLKVVGFGSAVKGFMYMAIIEIKSV